MSTKPPDIQAIKYDGAKPRLDLIPPDAMFALADVLTLGARKYSAWNWANGFEWSRPYAAMQRHVMLWWNGENVDPETNLSHLSHALCNLVFLVVHEKRKLGTDDRKVWPGSNAGASAEKASFAFKRPSYGKTVVPDLTIKPDPFDALASVREALKCPIDVDTAVWARGVVEELERRRVVMKARARAELARRGPLVPAVSPPPPGVPALRHATDPVATGPHIRPYVWPSVAERDARERMCRDNADAGRAPLLDDLFGVPSPLRDRHGYRNDKIVPPVLRDRHGHDKLVPPVLSSPHDVPIHSRGDFFDLNTLVDMHNPPPTFDVGREPMLCDALPGSPHLWSLWPVSGPTPKVDARLAYARCYCNWHARRESGETLEITLPGRIQKVSVKGSVRK